MTFEQVMELTRNVSAPAAFEEPECRLFYDTLTSLVPGSDIIEVGVEYGRSTSIILQVARELHHQVTLIDPFVDKTSGWMFMRMAVEVEQAFTLHKMTTLHWHEFDRERNYYDFAHIDGSHTAADLNLDCAVLLPAVRIGGYACFHDYKRDSLPDVFPTVNKFVRNDCWEEVAHVGTLLVMRRVA